MDARGKVISADCHVDLIWLPPDLFTGGAPVHLKDRMPYVNQDDKGRDVWVSRGGAYFGLVNGMGSAGREYVPGVIHRSDRMAAQGLYEDGAKGIRRLTDPQLRVRDQGLDGVRGEVLYGDPRGRQPAERRRGGRSRSCASTTNGSPTSARRTPTASPESPASPTTTSRRRSPRSSGSRSGARRAASRSRTPST